MPRGDWGAVFALGALVVVATGFGAFSTALHFTEKQQQLAMATYAYSINGEQRLQQYLTARAGIPATIERAISNPQPTTGQDHEKRDLAAQEASATFAWWMVVISGLGFLITTLGTFLLYQQIRLTREAVEDTERATKAMQRQNEIAKDVIRPWLRLTPPKTATFIKVTMDDGVECWAGVSVDIDLKNFGQSPAISPQADVLLFHFREAFDRLEAQNFLFKEMEGRGFGSAPIYPSDSANLGGETLFPSDAEKLIGCAPSEMIMMIGVRYKQPGRDEVFHVTTCFTVANRRFHDSQLASDRLMVTLHHVKFMTEAT